MSDLVCFAIAPAALLSGQSASPEFEVASVRPSAAAVMQLKSGVQVDGAQLHCSSLSLKDYIGTAYRVKYYQVEGPAWLASQRFDIDAKLPQGTARGDVPEMIRALLEERFQLRVHRETRDSPVYALAVGKSGVKMREAAAESAPETGAGGADGTVHVTASGSRAGTRVDFGHGSYFAIGNDRIEAQRLAMPSLAEMLARFVDRPVVDRTGLAPRYDFTLEFTPEDFRAMMVRAAVNAGVVLPPEAMRAFQDAHGDSLFTAIQMLGLRLEAAKAPLDLVVVDRVEKMPTEN